MKHQVMSLPNKQLPKRLLDLFWQREILTTTCQMNHVSAYVNDLCPQQQVSEAVAPKPTLSRRQKKVGKERQKDRLADEDGSLSATVNNTISSSLLGFLLYFKPVGTLPSS